MKNRRLWTLGVGALVATGLAGCDLSDITSVNENPNDPTEAPAPAVFTNGARLATSRWLGNANLRGWELVAQHLAEVQYPESDQYVRLRANSTSGNFDNAYFSELKDFDQVIRQGREQDAPGYWAPALIMQSWVFANLTDIWGDVPFSQALRGDDLDADSPFQPVYDPQEQIYDGLFQRLGEAASGLEGAGGPTLGAADPIYGGDLDRWQRFANSLRARHALRMVNVDPGQADAELAAAFNGPGGVFQSNADIAAFAWPGDGVFDNPWAVNFQTRDDHRISDRLLTYLGGWDDPRLPVYAMPAARDTGEAALGDRATKDCDLGTPCYVGLANALTHALAAPLVDYTSRPGEIFYGGNTAYGTFGGNGGSQPSYLMTYAEVLFIQAEAAERGLGGLSAGQAAGFYQDAIRASMAQWGVTDQAAIDAYLAQPEVAYQGGTEGLKQIAIQKWLALYSDGIQAWSEFRRTCQPAILRPGPEAIISEIPRRYEYSTTESAVNSANLNEAIARQGPDALTTPVWWDTNREAAPTYEAGCGVR